MKALYVLDAVNFLFRSYYAIGPMTNPKGESTNALFGFIRSLFKLMKDFSPNHLVAVFDGPKSTEKRKAIYSDYKIHRKKMPEDLYPQLEKCIAFCQIAGIPYLSIPGVEADDVMGSIAHWAGNQGINVYLCTSDKDLCQLVNDHVFVINAHKDNMLMDRIKVKEVFGVYPDQMVDLLAMMGDASDNIPGIEGIGPKTAATLLQEFGSLDELFAHPEKISEKKQQVITQGKELALLSRQLATIHLDVPFPQEELFFKLKAPQIEEVRSFYQEMHFMTLLKELENQQPEATAPTQEKYHLIDDEASLKNLIHELSKEKELCIDTETTDLNALSCDLVGIGLGVDPGEAWYIPMNGTLGKEKALSLIKPLLENPKIHFYGHNIKYDLHALMNQGIAVKTVSFDTLLASYLFEPHKQRHNLDQLTLEKFGKVKVPITDLIGKGKTQISMKEVPLEKITYYCCEDVDYTCRLKHLFQQALEREGLLPVFENIEIPLIPILMEMERMGMYLDVVNLKQNSEDLYRQLALLEEEIYALAEERFNINSHRQLGQILFEKLQIKPAKRTATGYATGADVLESLKETHPIIEKIIDYRVLEKLRSTYIDALPEQVLLKTGRIHCTFNQSGTATGRLSCQDPNLQNIPVRSVEGRKIRSAFRPMQENWSFLSADYSQIELRLLAHLSEDPVLIKAFKEGEDIHSYTASLVFNVPIKEVTPHMRDASKAVNFGILYGQQAFGLSKGIGIDIKEAARFIETYFQRYPKVKEYLESCKDLVRKTGKSVTITGRQRPIPEINSHNPMLRQAAERLAVNTPLQGTAADLIKLAMIHIDQYFKKHQLPGYMILQVHDELIFELPDDHIEQIGNEVKKMMEGVLTLKVPLVVDISIGKNWGEC